MKKSIILEMFDGERSSEFINATDKECKLYGVVSDVYDKLTARLSPRMLKLLKKYDAARDAAFNEEVRHFYAEGFKFGLLLAVECLE